MSSRKPKGGGKGRTRPRAATASDAAPIAAPDAPAVPDAPAPPPLVGAEPAPVEPALGSASLQSALEEVVALAERRVLERSLPPAAPVAQRPPATWLAAAGLSWLVVLLSLVRAPAWLEGPRPAPYAPPASLQAASDRYALWLAAGRITRFAARQQRLPSFLGETGFEDARVRYTVTGETSWTLEVADGGAALRLASTDDRDALLGSALEQLEAAP